MLDDFVYTEEDEPRGGGPQNGGTQGEASRREPPKRESPPRRKAPYGAPPNRRAAPRRSEAKRGRDAARRMEKVLKRFLAAVALVLCGALAWLFFVGPATMPATVTVFSFPGLERAEALRQAGIGERATFASVNAADAQLLLSRHPLVESARVVKNFPDRIALHIEPRQAVAVSIATINGRMQTLYFDRRGVAFRTGGAPGAGSLAAPWLPVVSGLYSEALEMRLGASLPDSVLPLFSRIGAITDENPGIWQAISEIGVAWNDNGTYDLVLYPVNSFTRLRMGSDITVEGIFYGLLMIDAIRASGDPMPGEIDARSGIGVIRTEEARLGG
jgi:cell division septal protein FtsQ